MNQEINRQQAHKEAKKRYYLKNRAKILAKQKEYDDKHRDVINERHREKKDIYMKHKVENQE